MEEVIKDIKDENVKSNYDDFDIITLLRNMIIIIYIVLKFFKKKKEKFLVFTTQVKVQELENVILRLYHYLFNV